MNHIVADVVRVVAETGAEQAVVVGHDWGASWLGTARSSAQTCFGQSLRWACRTSLRFLHCRRV
jgi:pimeloyl-ACP methyl ester carboxylesterase